MVEEKTVQPMMRHLIAGAAALAILGLGFLAWNALVPREPDAPVFAPVPEPEDRSFVPGTTGEAIAPAESPARAACVPVPDPRLPGLGESDPFVLAEIDDCLTALMPDEGPVDMLRRMAAVLENAARGELSRAGSALIEGPAGEFTVKKQGDRYYIDEATFRRYDPVVDSLTCVPPERLASLVRLFRPLLAQALRELGLPSADVGTVVDDALREILAVPAPLLPIEVVKTDKGFSYAYGKLEAASPLSKQLVRLGPDNLVRLQRHVSEVRAELRQPDPACVDSTTPSTSQ